MTDGPLTGYLVAKDQFGWAGLYLLFIKCYLNNSIFMLPIPQCILSVKTPGCHIRDLFL